MKMVTQKDIAQKIGVARSTVAIALGNVYHKNGAYVTEEKRAYIKKVAREMGYVVDDMARSIKTGKSNAIAYIAANWTNLYSATLAAEARGYTIEPFESASSKLMTQIKAKRIRCALIHHTLPKCNRQIQQLAENGIICGCTSMYSPQAHVNIFTDDDFGGTLAARKFIEDGHKNFAAVGSLTDDISAVRINAFARELEKHGFLLTDEYRVMTTNDSTIYNDIERFFSQHPKSIPTAFFCTKRRLTDCLCMTCGRYNFKFPEDFNVIAYASYNYSLPIWTIKEKREEMTKLAVDKLIDFIEGKRKNRFQKIYDVELIDCK